MMTMRKEASDPPRRRQARRPQDRAYLLCRPARGPGFLMLHELRAIMKYNPAEAYALAIGHLATLPRRRPFVHLAERTRASPRGALRAAALLAQRGSTCEPDGRSGQARNALRHSSRASGQVPEVRLRGGAGALARRKTLGVGGASAGTSGLSVTFFGRITRC